MLEPRFEVLPAVVEFDFPAYKEQLSAEIDQYRLVVTIDTVADAKKAATELNKLSQSIKDGFKRHLDELKVPYDLLNGYSKELQAICQDGRQAILDQVAKFEQLKLDEVSVLLIELREQLWKEFGVDAEFRNVDHSDLVKLSSLTASGSLAKAARDSIESRVNANLSLQMRTKFRLSDLENQCHRAGLAAPLSREHVESFLFADDATYSQRLAAMMERELEREQQARQRIQAQEREKAEADAKVKISEETKRLLAEADKQRADEQRKAEQQRMAEIDEVEHPTMIEREPVVDGDAIVYFFNAYYEIRVPAHINENQARMHLMASLIRVGMKPERVTKA